MFSGAVGAAQMAQGLGAIPSGDELRSMISGVSGFAASGMTGFMAGAAINGGADAVGVNWKLALATGGTWVLWYLTRKKTGVL